MRGRRPRPLSIATVDLATLQQIARSESLPWLIFYSCASVFDVSPLLMDQESYRSDKHSATLHRISP